MRNWLLLACIACFITVTISCTKTNNVTTTIYDSTKVFDTTIVRDTVYLNPKNPIVGLWTGSYFVNGNAVDSFMYQFDIRSDSTIYTIGSGTNQTAGYASGPWHLNGTTFTATLTSMNGVSPENVQTVSATYDSVSGRLYNGTWVDTRGNGGQTGTFSLRRIQ
jgi:hypothetical protein